MVILRLSTLLLAAIYSLCLLADPYTEMILQGADYPVGYENYYSRLHNRDGGSLPLVSSKFDKMSKGIAGTGFVLTVRESRNGDPVRRVLVTNSHLLDGVDKRYIDRHGGSHIEESEVLSCGEYDVAVVEYNGKGRSFGIYNTSKKKLITYGMNNSPRAYLTYDDYNFGDDHVVKNLNFRPIFENKTSNEILSFVQMGNMFDFSCNYFPSSPENYRGNALFVPVSPIVEKYTKMPIPYKQVHENTLGGMNGSYALFVQKRCHFNPSGEVRSNELLKQSYFSRNILLPAGIVPGMSGSPLLINNDLRQNEYMIAGIATSYDRKMQTSVFTSHKKIMKCIDQFLRGDRGHSRDVSFKYSKKFKSTYRNSGSISELPESGNAGGDFVVEDFDEVIMGGNGYGNGGGGLLEGNFDEMTLGGNGYGNGGGGLLEGNLDEMTIGGNGYGNGGDSSEYKKIEIPTGMLIDEELVIGFRCRHKKSKLDADYFANWEVLNITNNSEFTCEKILAGSNLSLSDMLKKRMGKNRIKGKRSSKDYNSGNNFEVRSKLTVNSKLIELNVYGYYNRKDSDKKIKFDEKIKISASSKSFQPRVEIPLEEGDSLIVDYRGLFFTDLVRLYITGRNQSIESALKKSNRPKVFISIKAKERARGMVPLVNEWK